MASAAVDTPMATEDERATKQFEFYFSDANLPYDKFMWKLHTQTEEHWIPIATVASFKRMREFERTPPPPNPFISLLYPP
ncbi:La protein homolog AltName: Full=La autoantigen homolog [Rhizoctonia solani AG-1 IB]|uniref:Rhizoctonia solani AG1-IB WGS project CAOJ00000000 data, isolate 7/3/14, contig 08900 n=1 Tax=Thanatephorus cucumeris (strain AG1-IB / isolate 7/3/14) TaxID=1108050 RepID=M5BSK2_THACB|nr:La protein homolog AltName: Full=La autoantigen homolog [Rhizoctonia solani AG-1 IB]